MNAKLLFVDDDLLVLSSFRRAIQDRHPEWNADYISCPVQAWERVQQERYDTIVTDMQMPRMTGLQLLERIKANEATRSVPVVIVTGSAEHDNKRKALDGGATDLLSKPVSVDDLVARIRNSLKIRDYEDQLERHSELLAKQVAIKTAELSASRLEIIWRLAKASEFRDEETGNHVVRVGAYGRIIAASLGLSQDYIDTIFHAAPLHDIGKLGIPDAILLKPGKLTAEQWTVMKSHCQIGVSILEDECKLGRLAAGFADQDSIATALSDGNPFLTMAADIARSHHEKWNGSGYPQGLHGVQIPVAARIVALSDVYDALRSRRPYKEPMQVERALAIIAEGRGEHFDPNVVDAFMENFDEIRAAENLLGDEQHRAIPLQPPPSVIIAAGELAQV